MTDQNGDGILGGNSGGHYHLTRKNESSFILVRIVLWLFIFMCIGLVVVTILAMLGNRFSINLIQDVIAGTK